MSNRGKTFALYDLDDDERFVDQGTMKELAQRQGISISTLSKAWKRKGVIKHVKRVNLKIERVDDGSETDTDI